MPHLQVALEVAASDLERADRALEQAGAMSRTYQSDDGTVLLEPGVAEHPLWERVRITALFPDDTDGDALYRRIRDDLGAAPQGWEATLLPDQDWERAWLDHFQPMAFGRRVWIVPTGADPELPDDAVTVHLDPGLAFGTGTHETTALCLEWLDREPIAGRNGVDYGAGSGVLAVAAARLGAASCLAIDNDPQAVRASQENAARNGVAEQVPAYAVDDAQRPAYCADFLVANILARTLAELADELCGQVRVGGRLALAGILEGQQRQVMDAFGSRIAWDAPVLRGDWVLLSGTRVA